MAKYILPADRVIAKLPDYQSFGRQSKLGLHPQYIPNWKSEPTVTLNTNLTSVTLKLDSTMVITAGSITTPIGSTF